MIEADSVAANDDVVEAAQRRSEAAASLSRRRRGRIGTDAHAGMACWNRRLR